MKKYWLAIGVIILSFHAHASDENKMILNDMIQTISKQTSASCENLKKLFSEYKNKGFLVQADAISGAMKNVCECMPEKINNLKVSATTKELNKQITPAAFLNEYKPVLIDQCAAVQFKYGFTEGCQKRFATVKRDSESYCGCMESYINQQPDSLIAKISTESADYIPKAANAKKHGKPLPSKPALLETFMDQEAKCSI